MDRIEFIMLIYISVNMYKFVNILKYDDDNDDDDLWSMAMMKLTFDQSFKLHNILFWSQNKLFLWKFENYHDSIKLQAQMVKMKSSKTYCSSTTKTLIHKIQIANTSL